MTRIELAIKALEELPEDRREVIADIVLDVIATHSGGTALTEGQWAEIDRRRAAVHLAQSVGKTDDEEHREEECLSDSACHRFRT